MHKINCPGSKTCTSLIYWSHALCVKQIQKLKISQRMLAYLAFCHPQILKFLKANNSFHSTTKEVKLSPVAIIWTYEVILYLPWCLYFPKPYANHCKQRRQQRSSVGRGTLDFMQQGWLWGFVRFKFWIPGLLGEENYFWSGLI